MRDYLKRAMAELCFEVPSPIDMALMNWAQHQQPGVLNEITNRYLCDHLRALVLERAELIKKNLPEELKSLQ